MASRRAELVSVTLALMGVSLTPAAALAQSPAARMIYCCDVGGQPVCGDILPEACYGRAYREVSPSGTVRRVVPAPLTPEEIAARDAEVNERRVEAALQLKQQRMDEALLETYRSLPQLDARRDREIGALDLAIQALRQREGELIERQRVLIEEAAQAGEGNVSPVLEENIHSLDGEIVAQRSVIAAKMRERAALLDRFDEDRQRYIRLTTPAAQPGRR